MLPRVRDRKTARRRRRRALLTSSSPSSSSSSSTKPLIGANLCFFTLVIITLLTVIIIPDERHGAEGCMPGRSGYRRRSPRRLSPLVFNEHVPNVAETTLGASGPVEGPIWPSEVLHENALHSPLRHQRSSSSSSSSRHIDLVPNYNPDIVYKDRGGMGHAKMMSARLKEKINTLAISVMNQWPGTKLRVIEGWIEPPAWVPRPRPPPPPSKATGSSSGGSWRSMWPFSMEAAAAAEKPLPAAPQRRHGKYANTTLHHEGRAVDLTTQPRDPSKYGMLARLAVEAGFDWVYYEAKSHIHASVKSESTQGMHRGGCFDAETRVATPDGGTKQLSAVRPGDRVLVWNEATRAATFSEVLTFLDRDPDEERLFLEIVTRPSGHRLHITPGHLIYVQNEGVSGHAGGFSSETATATFAYNVRVGDRVYVLSGGGGNDNGTSPRELIPEEVASLADVRSRGVYAPLTREGTILVNGLQASCYALIEDQQLAHWSFGPLRGYYNLMEGWDHVLQWFRRTEIVIKPPQKRTDGPKGPGESAELATGVHWYARLLYQFAHNWSPLRERWFRR